MQFVEILKIIQQKDFPGKRGFGVDERMALFSFFDELLHSILGDTGIEAAIEQSTKRSVVK